MRKYTCTYKTLAMAIHQVGFAFDCDATGASIRQTGPKSFEVMATYRETE